MVSVRTELLPFLPVQVLPLPQEHLILSEAGPDFAPSSLPAGWAFWGVRASLGDTCPLQPWVSICVDLTKTLAGRVWVSPDLSACPGTSTSQPQYSPTKGRCPGSTRPDGTGGSPGTQKEVTSPVAARSSRTYIKPPPHTAPNSKSERGAARGAGPRAHRGRGLQRARERDWRCLRAHRRGPRAARYGPDGGGRCRKRAAPRRGGVRWGGSGPAAARSDECVRGPSLEAASGASEGLG